MRLEKKSLIAITVGSLIALYLVISLYFTSHFYPRTTINSVNAGGHSISGVIGKLVGVSDNYTLTVTEEDGTTHTYNKNELGLKVYATQQRVAAMLSNQSGFGWPVALIIPTSYDEYDVITCDDGAVSKIANKLVKEINATATPSQDAYVDFNGKEFVVVEEVYGNELDDAVVMEKIMSAVMSLKSEVKLDGESCYIKPALTKDAEEFKGDLQDKNRFVTATIEYEYGGNTVSVDPERKKNWYSFGASGISLNEEDIRDYVSELADTVNTVKKDKSLISTATGKNVKIVAGDYGWKLDEEAEFEQLKTDLLNGIEVKRSPVFSQEANSATGNDYGDTYVECDLSAQHMYFYVDGELYMDTDFVSGNVYLGRGTHPGAYFIKSKETERILRGPGYESFVHFWMPFHNGEGLHDATWRNSFGGHIYKGNGSHGCLNLPKDKAETFYNKLELGCPVLVFYSNDEDYFSDSAYKKAASLDAAIAGAMYDANPVAAIQNCRATYNSLSAEQKRCVKNYQLLQSLEAQIYSYMNGGVQ